MRTTIRHLRIRDASRLEEVRTRGVLALPVLFPDRSTMQAPLFTDIWSREGRFWLVCQQTHDQLQVLIPPAHPGDSVRVRVWVDRGPKSRAGREFVQGTCRQIAVVKSAEGSPVGKAPAYPASWEWRLHLDGVRFSPGKTRR